MDSIEIAPGVRIIGVYDPDDPSTYHLRPDYDPINANKGTERGEEALSESMETYGAARGIVLDRNGVAPAGNKTLRAAVEHGKKILIIETDGDTLLATQRPDWDLLAPPEDPAFQMAAGYGVTDNRVSDLNLNWDPVAIKALLDRGLEMPEVIFRPIELEDIVATLDTSAAPAPSNDSTGTADDDDVPEAEPRSAPGHLYQLGNHLLYCGDAADQNAVDLVATDAFDLVWTDPPYNLSYVGKTADALKITNDAQQATDFRAMLTAAFHLAYDRCRPGAVWYVCGPPGPGQLVFADLLYEDLAIWRQTIIWVKDQFVLGHSDLHYRHEPIFYGWKDGTHTVPMREGAQDRTQDTVWEIARSRASEVHPTMKPLELVRRSLRNSSKRGDLVYDPFAGSGTTLLTCEELGRHARCLELDPHYVDVILARWEEMTGMEARRLS